MVSVCIQVHSPQDFLIFPCVTFFPMTMSNPTGDWIMWSSSCITLGANQFTAVFEWAGWYLSQLSFLVLWLLLISVDCCLLFAFVWFCILFFIIYGYCESTCIRWHQYSWLLGFLNSWFQTLKATVNGKNISLDFYTRGWSGPRNQRKLEPRD